MPVGRENLAAIDRSLRSVVDQQFIDWELLAVDYESAHGRNDALKTWAQHDSRICVGRVVQNRCPGAARNAALRRARGSFVTYLDPGDEYCAHHFWEVVAALGEAELAFFGFDLAERDGLVENLSGARGHGIAINRLFAVSVAPAMAVAHRRSLVKRVGLFNEVLFRGEDWDYWKRLVRAGARFVVTPDRGGRHATRIDRANAGRLPTSAQWTAATTNWRAGRPLFHDSQTPLSRREIEKIVGNSRYHERAGVSKKSTLGSFRKPKLCTFFRETPACYILVSTNTSGN
jgi:hypothetical protein